MILLLRRWYFRVFPHYRRLELRLLTYSEADNLLLRDEGWRIAIPEENYNTLLHMVYLERRERITE